jgi:hypothetical protein
LEAFLFLDGLDPDAKSPPIQWQNYLLMRDVFHCTPSELKAQSPHDIAAVLVCIETAEKIRKLKNPPGSLV